ncbi:LOW QUALITY PROTEIN: NUT family member 2G-like [Pteronotus mesoamericanus]|uniref:LOW QUALITY PROTEIN: NUT family member 2G-like n=1 Tax=Pteronotus mesoamericanus TaxID=1884717 RepID=UPI0023EBD21E|nr:LOW QUALITY PROTEIN: NUT family member 2G-like [Pteronotus parnellii mesoamericanus]
MARKAGPAAVSGGSSTGQYSGAQDRYVFEFYSESAAWVEVSPEPEKKQVEGPPKQVVGPRTEIRERQELLVLAHLPEPSVEHWPLPRPPSLPALGPSPAAECLESCILLFKFKLFPPLDAEHLLEQVTLQFPCSSFLIAEAARPRWSVPRPAGMTSQGASAVLGADVTTNPGASMTPLKPLPFPQPTAGPEHLPPLEQLLLPLKTLSLPAGFPPALPGLPGTPLVAGGAGRGPIGTGACDIMDKVRSEAGRPRPPQTQTRVLTQAPGSTPGALCGGAVCPAPPFLEASAVEAIMSTLALGGAPAGEGGWCPGFPPRAPPKTAQLASIVPSVDTGARLHGASGGSGLAASQSEAAPDDFCNPKNLHENFQRWRRFKALARRHLPQSPDAEALSCFLIPVLRSLSRLKPTMTLEEGIGQAMQEWDRKSNYDRMTYYEMAETFMELEAEEEMQIQKLQLMRGAQGLPAPAPPRPDPRGPPASVVGPQPGTAALCIQREDVPWVQGACRPLGSRETETSDEIPPEAVQEYMDIMDELEGLTHPATGAQGGEREEDRKEPQQEQDETYLDPGLLSYIEYLCSQEDYVTKVEAIPNHLLKPLVSAEALLAFTPVAEKLAQELGLPPVQLEEERVLASKEEEGVQAPPSHGASRLDSSPSESAGGQDVQRWDHGPRLRVGDKACPPEAAFKGRQKRRREEAHLSRPRAVALSSGQQECPPLRAPCPSSAPQGHRRTYPRLAPRDASIPRETSRIRETVGPVGRPSENEEDLPSLAFLMASPKNLLPCALSLSPVSASGPACPGGWGPPRAAQSQPRKRKCDQSATGSRGKRHCSSYGAAACPSYCQPQTRWGCPD